MTTNNQQQGTARKASFGMAISTTGFQAAIKNALRDEKRVSRFITAITSAVATNPALQECAHNTILSAALLGESLNLSPSPQLGQYYLVPFKQKEKRDRQGNVISPECTNATFVLGYKGMIQLAIRSGQYRFLNVGEVKEGELRKYNFVTEELIIEPIEDYERREKAQTTGYYAMFEYLNGFRKTLYWSKEKMVAHADQYSPAFSRIAYERIQRGEIPQNEMWKYSSFWYKDFDGMAKKTMLRQLISKWGVMSIEMITAIEKDDGGNIVEQGGALLEVGGGEELAPALPEQPSEPPYDAAPGDDGGGAVSLKDL
jgi:recombination protein RecT